MIPCSILFFKEKEARQLRLEDFDQSVFARSTLYIMALENDAKSVEFLLNHGNSRQFNGEGKNIWWWTIIPINNIIRCQHWVERCWRQNCSSCCGLAGIHCYCPGDLKKNKMTNMSRESASKPRTTMRWKDICKNLDEWVSSLIWPGPSFEWSWREQCWWWQSKCFALSLLAGRLHPLHHYHHQVGHILFSLFNVIWKTDGSTKTA